MFEAQMIQNRSADGSPLESRWSQIAGHVTTGDGVQQVRESVNHEQPCKKEVPAPAHRQILIAGDGQPGRKPASGELSAAIAGCSEDPRGMERLSENLGP